MTAVHLDHIGFALGSVAESVEEAEASGLLVSPAAALAGAGFRRHHRSPEGETAYDLARRACAPLGSALHGVGAIVYSTCIPGNASVGSPETFATSRDVKHLMDFPASHLQADLGLDEATVIGLSQQACTGLLGSLRLARGLLAAEPDLERVLCLTADRFPPGALYEQSYNLISDGAAACVVSRAPAAYRVLAVHGITNGALARASDEETAGSFFSFAHRLIHETVRRAGLELADLHWFVAQNMNRTALDVLARLLPFDPARVVAPTLGEVGHVISGDNLINLRRLQEDGRVEPGQRVLLFMAGYGLNWQCAILERAR